VFSLWKKMGMNRRDLLKLSSYAVA
jgi:hypothetical protein